MATKQERIDRAVAVEIDQRDRACLNIERNGAGVISEHDIAERIARRVQQAENRIAWIKGERRPKQREQQPLDDPDAGKVG